LFLDFFFYVVLLRIDRIIHGILIFKYSIKTGMYDIQYTFYCT